ncbi:DUF2958 domain-containing protein [bacterium]|nr:DUF2958 domain-containing protein [bacterium]
MKIYQLTTLPGKDGWRYSSLNELESIKRRFGLTIERDLYFLQ